MVENHRVDAVDREDRVKMRDLPPTGAKERDLIVAIRELIRGRSNATFTVTLTPGASSTVITTEQAPNLNENAFAFLQPLTSAAAAANATTHTQISRTSGAIQLVITHANTAATDRTFACHVIGG